jgi:hypothetical protein
MLMLISLWFSTSRPLCIFTPHMKRKSSPLLIDLLRSNYWQHVDFFFFKLMSLNSIKINLMKVLPCTCFLSWIFMRAIWFCSWIRMIWWDNLTNFRAAVADCRLYTFCFFFLPGYRWICAAAARSARAFAPATRMAPGPAVIKYGALVLQLLHVFCHLLQWPDFVIVAVVQESVRWSKLRVRRWCGQPAICVRHLWHAVPIRVR